MFVFWRQRNPILQEVSAHWLDHLNLMGGNRPELIAADIATRFLPSIRRAHPLPKNIYICRGPAAWRYRASAFGGTAMRPPIARRIAGRRKLGPVLLPSAGDRVVRAADYPSPLARRAVSCIRGLDFRFGGLFRNPSHTARPNVHRTGRCLGSGRGGYSRGLGPPVVAQW